MAVLKLFSGEQFACDIVEDHENELVIAGNSSLKQVILKKDIFSIDVE
jgi:hypothetical protein